MNPRGSFDLLISRTLLIATLALQQPVWDARAADKSSPAGDSHTRPAEPDATRDTADEPYIGRFSLRAAADYLDRRAHLAEKNCYACHSTFTYLPARGLIDPLGEEVMRTRVLLERIMTLLLEPAQVGNVNIPHVSRVRILAAVELARHDAIATGALAPITRRSLDAMWRLQKADGGIAWIQVAEASQAIDDWWPAAMMAIGTAEAPEDYAETPAAKAGVEKLRHWFRAHPPQNNHERGLTLLAHSAVGGIAADVMRQRHIEAIFTAQRLDGGWSVPSLADWKRADGKSLDPGRSDGYATGMLTYVLARNGVTPDDPRMRKAIEWLKSNQRRSGGWFTQSPFKRDILASNTGTSFAVQALAASGEFVTPKVTAEQFAAAHADADKSLPAGVYVPNAENQPALATPPAAPFAAKP